ncbi:MAG: hypothetical protein R2849_00570 [Thermomicrobiales bacterium]
MVSTPVDSGDFEFMSWFTFTSLLLSSFQPIRSSFASSLPIAADAQTFAPLLNASMAVFLRRARAAHRPRANLSVGTVVWVGIVSCFSRAGEHVDHLGSTAGGGLEGIRNQADWRDLGFRRGYLRSG